MKYLAVSLALVFVCISPAARADSTVVFNEIMYHPQTNEAQLEWVELYNQMAVDMDISGWYLTNAIGYKFAEGTVIPGGGYLRENIDREGAAIARHFVGQSISCFVLTYRLPGEG